MPGPLLFPFSSSSSSSFVREILCNLSSCLPFLVPPFRLFFVILVPELLCARQPDRLSLSLSLFSILPYATVRAAVAVHQVVAIHALPRPTYVRACARSSFNVEKKWFRFDVACIPPPPSPSPPHASTSFARRTRDREREREAASSRPHDFSLRRE